MADRFRIKLRDEIDEKMKERIKCFVKTFMMQHSYFTFTAFCRDFNEYLISKGKRNNFTDRVLSNKLTRGDIRLYEIILMLDFLNCDICFKNKNELKN